MFSLKSVLQRLIGKRRHGQGMTEYIILVGLVGLVLIAAVGNYGEKVDEAIEGSIRSMNRYTPPDPGTPNGFVGNSGQPIGETENGANPVYMVNDGGEWAYKVGSPNLGAADYDPATHGAIR